MPAGKTYVKIASQTLSGSASSVTFSNLPQNYTDLVLIISAKTSGGNAITYQLNTDSTASNYSQTGVGGDGTSTFSFRQSLNTLGAANSSGFNVYKFNFQNYSNTTTFKTVLANGGQASADTRAAVSLWRNTSAINQIILAMYSGETFQTGSTFTIYGIEAAKSPKAEGGDKVYSTGTHWVHEFYNSGTFVPTQNLTADYLVVAGGGGGAEGIGGGGGAGGLRCTVTATGGGGSLESALSLTGNTSYTVTVGAGGVGGINGSSPATNGSNSVFSSITSTGGGRGGSNTVPQTEANTGGSGGGARNNGSGTAPAGSGTANQGFAGGTTVAGSGGQRPTGGGGGAGGVGGNGVSNAAGNGGPGVTTSITGSSVTYAGGGGGTGTGAVVGGTGGSGGGGAGGSAGSGARGTANLGGGGGGADSSPATGGNGGSGIVIVRYSI